MTTSDPTGMHDWHSLQYVEDWIASSVQRDETRRLILRRVASLIPRDPDAAMRVLDVGCGYGALSAQVLDLFPQAVVVCQDFSEPMFAHARERLAWASPRVSFTHSDLSDASWTLGLAGPFDAVVSAIAIHNVRYPERIRAIYGEIFGLVAPGGCFFNYDLIFPSGPAATEAYQRAKSREEWLRAPRSDVRLADTMTPQTHEHPGSDQPRHSHHEGVRSARGIEHATLEQQLRWLREAGFEDVECFWKELQSAIIGGFRSASVSA
jgi:tRNA (cmo5U34)-methyltransferase